MDSDSEDEESDHEGQNNQGQTDEEPLGSDDDINEGSDGEIFETGIRSNLLRIVQSSAPSDFRSQNQTGSGAFL